VIPTHSSVHWKGFPEFLNHSHEREQNGEREFWWKWDGQWEGDELRGEHQREQKRNNERKSRQTGCPCGKRIDAFLVNGRCVNIVSPGTVQRR